MNAEVQLYARAPWGSQKWYVLITDPDTGEQAVCGHSHISAELANKCANKHNKDTSHLTSSTRVRETMKKFHD